MKLHWWYLQENNGTRTGGQNAKCRVYRRTNFFTDWHSVTNNNGLLNSSRVRFHSQLYMRKNVQCLWTDVFHFRHRTTNNLYADTSISYPKNINHSIYDHKSIQPTVFNMELSMPPQPFVGPWPLVQFLNPINSR
jgi:hypothetical protein